MVHYPPVGFYFKVSIENLNFPGFRDVGFQEITGINADIGIEEYREGGENRFAHRLPNPVTYQNLILKRGMLNGAQSVEWFRNAVESFQFEPHDLMVSLQDEQNQPLQSWSFVNAWPVKWSISSFNAEQNALVIESMEFSYQYFRRL